jgi:hypothetical protein
MALASACSVVSRIARDLPRRGWDTAFLDGPRKLKTNGGPTVAPAGRKRTSFQAASLACRGVLDKKNGGNAEVFGFVARSGREESAPRQSCQASASPRACDHHFGHPWGRISPVPGTPGPPACSASAGEASSGTARLPVAARWCVGVSVRPVARGRRGLWLGCLPGAYVGFRCGIPALADHCISPQRGLGR